MSSWLAADCAVVGLGPAGLASALALAHEGFSVAAIGLKPVGHEPDLRTAALFDASVRFLGNLNVWPALAPTAAPLAALRLVDATHDVLHTPEIVFRADEIGLEQFGFNVENARLDKAMRDAAIAHSSITVIEARMIGMEMLPSCVRLRLEDGGGVKARLVAAADGRSSLVRAVAGIGVNEWTYPQMAIATRFRHSRPHHSVSTEFHRKAGPLTTVPMPGEWSSLVWVDTAQETRRLMALDQSAFGCELEDRLSGLLGIVEEVGARGAFPLKGMAARRMASRRVALVGEAGHVLPPIGAQGLNLGLRDAATLAEDAAYGRNAYGDPGAEPCLERYADRREPDIASRSMAVDLLNRSVISEFAPVAVARGAFLALIEAMPWLRSVVMREGMQPNQSLPRLMQA